MERWQSGRMQLVANQPTGDGPGVRIPFSPLGRSASLAGATAFETQSDGESRRRVGTGTFRHAAVAQW